MLLNNGPFVVIFSAHAENFDLPLRLTELFGQLIFQRLPPSCVDVAEKCAVLNTFQAVIEADIGDFFCGRDLLRCRK